MATVRMPSSLHAQITRSAISPRLAIRIFLNMKFSFQIFSGVSDWKRSVGGKEKGAARRAPTESPDSLLRPYDEQLLAVFDRLAVDRQFLDDLPGNVRFNLVQQLHGLDDAEDLPDFDRVSRFDEWRSAGRGCFVERPDDGRLHRVKPFFGSRCRRRGRWRGDHYGHGAQFRRCPRCRRHRIEARFPMSMDDGMVAGALDPDLDIAALQLKLGNILFD